MKARMLACAAVSVLALARPGVARADDEPRTVDVPPAPPGGGLDADVEATLQKAEEALASSRPDVAVPLVLQLHLAPNRFSEAQASILVPRSAALLRRAGASANARGDRDAALRAYDAAWSLDHREDAAHTAALVASSDAHAARGDEDAALWLARRALRVSPSSEPARERDDRSSESHRATWSYALLGLGIVGAAGAIAAGAVAKDAKQELESGVHPRDEADDLVAKQKTFGVLSTVGIGVAVASYVGFTVLLLAGGSKTSPRSPSFLPVLPERR